MTATSGPGMDLKAEMIGLAVMLELPLIVIDVQRAGPSTGMPTKTEQSDLLMALHGRHGESPAAGDRAQHRRAAASRRRSRPRAIAIRYRTPVILLSDSFLASSSEPWLIPDVGDAARDRPRVRHRARPTTSRSRPTAATRSSPARGRSPAPRGCQHRIGGLEKADGSGNISYDGANHERMTELRAAKVAAIADEIPPLVVDSEPERRTCSCSAGARPRARSAPACGWPGRPGTRSRAPSCATSTRCPPTPATCCAPSSGCWCPSSTPASWPRCCAARFLVDVESYTKVQGQPLFAGEILEQIAERNGR